MPSFRFCRPDDIPLLVRAVNECFMVHSPAVGPLTIDAFQREVREWDIWASNCMLALEGKDPIGVLTAGKRPREVLIHRVGVRPDRLRQGYGRHLVTSLGQKLAVLGPPRLTAEISSGDALCRRFFEACGYRHEADFTDWRLDHPLPALEDTSAVIPLTVEEAYDNDLLEPHQPSSWFRAPETLLDRKESLEGLAIASPDGIEAFLLYEGGPGPTLVWRLGAADRTHGQALLAFLLRCLARPDRLPILVPLLAHTGSEIQRTLKALGFEPLTQTALYAGQAEPL